MEGAALRSPLLRVHSYFFLSTLSWGLRKLVCASVQRLLFAATPHPTPQRLITQLALTLPRFGLAARVGSVMRLLQATLAVDDTLQELDHTVTIQRHHLGGDLGLNEEILFLAPKRRGLALLLESIGVDCPTSQLVELAVEPPPYLWRSGSTGTLRHSDALHHYLLS